MCMPCKSVDLRVQQASTQVNTKDVAPAWNPGTWEENPGAGLD